MVEIVLDNVPDDPLTRDAGVPSWESLPEVGRRPESESALDHVPGCLKTVDQFSGAMCQAIFVPFHQRSEVCTAFAHDEVKPPDTGGDDMTSEDTYRAKVWRGL